MAEIVDLRDKIRRYYKFTPSELRGLIISILVVAFIISFSEWGVDDKINISLGLVIIVFSAEYILKIAEFFVITYGIGGSLIGILAIGIATALPELTTSVTAILRGATSISIGTLIGSNITNPMFALGLGAMISTYQVPKPIIVFDLPVKIITAIIIMAFLWTSSKLSKRESSILIGMYVVYILLRIKYFAVDI